MKNIKSFLKQCIAEVVVEPTEEGKLASLAMAGLLGIGAMKSAQHTAKHGSDSDNKPKTHHVSDPTKELPGEKNMDGWDLADKYSTNKAKAAKGLQPMMKFTKFIKECIAEVMVEPAPRKIKVYGNPRRLRATHLIKECIVEVLRENLLAEGFDPTSQGPNMPQENPYPEMNAKMARLEEEQPKDDSWARYEKGYNAGKAHKRSGVKPEGKMDSVAKVGYHDAITGKDSATPETVRKTVKEYSTVEKWKSKGQPVVVVFFDSSQGKNVIAKGTISEPQNTQVIVKLDKYVGLKSSVVVPWEYVKPIALGMTDPIKETDSGEISTNPHGRYAQQAGAGQFDPDTFGKLNEYDDQEAVITKVKKEVYAALAKEGFQPHGDQPRDYVEYYLNGFMTVQVSVGYDSKAARVERYYDSEMVNNMAGHNVVKSFPVPVPYNAAFVQKFIKYAIALKRSGVGDESIFGGIDDLTESHRTQSTEVEWLCPHCGQSTNIPVEIESPSDYIACADCEHCSKEISDPKLDQMVYAEVIDYYSGKADYLKDIHESDELKRKTKSAKDLHAGDVIVSDNQNYTVKRVIGPTRAEPYHVRVYFREGSSSTVRKETQFKLK